MEIIGIIKSKQVVESGVSKAGKEWKKQSIVLDMNKDFNSDVCISFFGDDKVARIQAFEVGMSVKVGVNVSSREFNGKFYHNIDGWRIDTVDAPSFEAKPSQEEDTSGDLPF